MATNEQKEGNNALLLALNDNMRAMHKELTDLRVQSGERWGGIMEQVKHLDKIEQTVDQLRDRQNYLLLKVVGIGAAAGMVATVVLKKLFG